MSSRSISENAGHFITYVKIALATAIIKQKPDDKSAEEFTQELCAKYQIAQSEWKDKAKQLESKVLSLEQKLFLLQNHEISATVHDSDEGNEVDHIYPTPPFSSEQPPTPGVHTPSDIQLSQHTTFLRCFLTLQSAKPTSCFLREHAQLAVTSVTQALEEVQQWLCDGALRARLPKPLVRETVRAVQDVLERGDGRGDASDEAVRQALIQFVQYAVASVVKNPELGQNSHQKDVCEMIIQLGVTPQLVDKVLVMLATCVKEFTDLLRETKRNCSGAHPHLHENMFYILSCLEQLVESKRTFLSSAKGERTLNNIKLILEDSVLHLSENHPLLCHHIWHISGLLESMNCR